MPTLNPQFITSKPNLIRNAGSQTAVSYFLLDRFEGSGKGSGDLGRELEGSPERKPGQQVRGDQEAFEIFREDNNQNDVERTGSRNRAHVLKKLS